MGRPMPGWDVQILDQDEQPVPQGERGEICLRARSNPHYPLGYWHNEEAAQETFGGDWFHTKDAATLRRGRLRLVRGPRRRRDHRRGLPDRAVRGRVARASSTPRSRRRRRSPRPTSGAAAWSRRSSCWPRARGLRRAGEGDPGARASPAVRLRLPAQDRVRRGPPEDADRQDPADRAAPARAGGRTLAVATAVAQARERTRGTRALLPQSVARLVGLAALGAVGALRVAAAGRGARRRPRRCCGSRRPSRAAARRCWPPSACRAGARLRRRCALPARGRCVVAVRRLLALRAPGSTCSSPRHWDELLSGLGGGLQALGTVRLPYVSADPWPRIVLELLGARAADPRRAADVLAARGDAARTRACR